MNYIYVCVFVCAHTYSCYSTRGMVLKDYSDNYLCINGFWRAPTSKMVKFRLLFGILGSCRRHLKPNHLSPPSQSQHLANSQQPHKSDTSISSCPFLYNPAHFPNKVELSGELLLCVAPFLSLVPKPGRRDTPTGPRLPPNTSSSLPSSSFSGAGSSHSPLLSGL